jgi:hypothetical protein
MTELSPAAIAVDDALAACIQLQGEIVRARPLAAAALRAAADQVVPEMTTPWNSTLTPKVSAADVRLKLLAIAAELEQLSD